MSLPPSNGKIVLVSGINGYIASSIGLDLLKKGYTLRGTLRNQNHADALVNGAYNTWRDRVQMVIVSNMIADGAFDEAVKGVTAVIHPASPISSNNTTWDDAITPAVQGSLGILNSAFKHAGPRLESFVLTSSVAAVRDKYNPTQIYTEEDWNEWAEPQAKDGDTTALYAASKTMGERAIWEFRDEKKPKFSISAVLPAVVIGPPVQPAANPDDLNMTIKPLWEIFSGACAGDRDLPPVIGIGSVVDVRDVAALHIWCAENPSDSNGQRYIISNGRGTPQAVADLLRKVYPDRKGLPAEKPEKDYDSDYSWPKGGPGIQETKAKGVLGRDLIGFERSVIETVEAFERFYARYLTGEDA
ncbi:hypothetical protein MMC22_007581 [Lobaria immixta]|nr:hypothetical protein [Lobaria immixta]